MGTRRFDFEAAEASVGWLDTPRPSSSHDPNVAAHEYGEAHDYGVSSLHFAAPGRPFHPQRLWAALEPLVDGAAPAASAATAGEGPGAKLLRSKGVVWLATRAAAMGDWSQAGADVHFDFGGAWPQAAAAVSAGGAAASRSSLVLIGQGLDKSACEAALRGALLTDAEVARGPDAWAQLPDPFPPWEMPE